MEVSRFINILNAAAETVVGVMHERHPIYACPAVQLVSHSDICVLSGLMTIGAHYLDGSEGLGEMLEILSHTKVVQSNEMLVTYWPGVTEDE